MRSYAFIAPFVAAALAQESSEATNATVVAISSGSSTVSTTVPYTNGFTSFLTETNSMGVVTGMPAVATSQSSLPEGVSTQPGAITTQPAVATIPAGLPTGVTYVMQNISRSLTSFEVSVGSSTTVVINSPTGVSITTGGSSPTSSSSGSSNSGDDDSDSSSDSPSGTSDSDSSSGTSTSTAASSTSSDSGASSNLKYASAGVLGFGAMVFALL